MHWRMHACRQFMAPGKHAEDSQLSQEATRALEEASQTAGSHVLHSLVTPGERFPHMQQPLQQLTNATDWDAACASGQIIPAEASPPFDAFVVLMSLHPIPFLFKRTYATLW